MKLEEINKTAWELAAEYVEWNEVKKILQSISNRRLEMIFHDISSGLSLNDISQKLQSYSPLDEEKKYKVLEFWKKLSERLKAVDSEENKIVLVKFLRWNVELLVTCWNDPQLLRQIMDAENISKEVQEKVFQRLKHREGGSKNGRRK
jgi:hypothetical protein